MPDPRRGGRRLLGAALAVGVILVPPAFGQKARLTVLAGLGPVRDLARTVRDWVGPSRSSGEVQRELDYCRGLAVEHLNQIQKLRARIDQAPVPVEGYRFLSADVVVPSDGSPWRRSLTLAVGTRGGAAEGMVVVYGRHLVGRVVEVAPWSCRVLLVVDPAFRVGAVAVPRGSGDDVSPQQRHLGVYEGSAGERGRLKWITGDTLVEEGAYVLTTADPGLGVPPGLIVGRVAALSGTQEAYPRVEVEPLVNYRALEQVSLLSRAEGP